MSEELFELGMWGELVGSIVIDIIGMISYLVPGIGESIDIGTAPLNIWWVYEMLTDVEEPEPYVAEVFSAFAGFEELAPFIDVIPSATLAWLYKWVF